jgi:acyl-coenzyme A synthetase/AMP-(fatty) acid ligase
VGTLFIDGGRPAPGQIEQTVRNLIDFSPTIYFNVPAGYNALLPYLERDPGLAGRFFERLQLIFYAGAALPQDAWERLEALSVRTTGERVPMTSSWGATETAPAALAAHFPLERAGPPRGRAAGLAQPGRSRPPRRRRRSGRRDPGAGTGGRRPRPRRPCRLQRRPARLSTRIARVLIMTEPPSIDAGEITDKGYVNQRATLERRSALVDRLYAAPPDPEVIVL